MNKLRFIHLQTFCGKTCSGSVKCQTRSFNIRFIQQFC